MSEIWRDVKGFESLYEVSSLARVRAKGRNVVRKFNGEHICYKKPLILKQELSNVGYYKVSLYKDKKYHHRTIHRLVAESFIPNPDNKPCVNHINGDHICNFPENLEWVTYSENSLHSYRIGLSNAKADKNGRASMTNKDVVYIRKIYKASKMLKEYFCRKYAKKYGCSRTTIFRIVNESHWKSIL